MPTEPLVTSASVAKPARGTLSETALPGEDFSKLVGLEVATGPFSVGPSRPDVGALIVNHCRIDETVLDRFPSLRVVSRFGIGYENVDVAACTRRGIQVGITPGPVEVATAEMTIALMLASRREVLDFDRLSRRGEWSAPIDTLPSAKGLFGSRLGLVGMGRIAEQVALRAAAMGMELLYHARHVSERAEKVGAGMLPLDELLSTCDVVSLHVPLTRETTGLIDARRLGLMRYGATLINTSRGAVINEQALIEAVRQQRICAALDVFAHEPQVPAALLALPNTVLTPHVGSATDWARRAMTTLAVANVLAGLAGQSLPHRVPEQRNLTPSGRP